VITEKQQVTKKYFDTDDNAYLIRLNAEQRRRIFWCDWSGGSPTWVIQIIDNEGNQIDDARYAANKANLADTLEHSYTEPESF
jgi:hypothetical protein